MGKKTRTAREALVEVLKRNGGEMEAKDIIAKAIPLATGLTSEKTMKGTLYGTLREEALNPKGKVVKVSKGVYRHKTAEEMAVEPEPAPAPEPKADVEAKPDPKPSRKRTRSTARRTKEPAAA